MMFLWVAFVSSSALADCIQVVGEYLCPEAAASEWMLGSRDVSVTYKSLLKGFVLKAGQSDVFYELNSWNPAMSSNGEIDHTVQVMALCDAKNKLTLRHVVSEDKISIQQDWILASTADGIDVRSTVDGDEFAAFTCKRK